MGNFVNPGNDAFQATLNAKIYVDKSGLLNYTNSVLASTDAYICNSRPRRFGKSITANMLTAYYSRGCDSEEMFSQLEISQSPDFKKHLNKYDVIHLDVQWCMEPAGGPEHIVSYISEQTIMELMMYYPDVVTKNMRSLPEVLARINAATGRRFVIIIDEWDVVIRDEAANLKVQNEYISFLRGLFKGTEPTKYIQLAYLTGILPIRKEKTQSALNNFDEFTMLSPSVLAKYIGFTEDEVRKLSEAYHQDFEKVKRWYDGYFLNDYQVYNPRAVVSVMLKGEFKSYWSETASYEAIVPLINRNYDGLKTAIIEMLSGSAVKVNTATFTNDIVNIRNKNEVLTYMIHLGYLGYDQDAQTAFIPNEEIRQELTAATRRNPKNISVSLRNYNKNIADKTVLSSRKDENTMKYDFTTILDRKGKDSIAVEPFEADWIKWPGKTKEGFDIIPMWVADMNFPAVHTIPEAIIERTKHTTYGYFSPREEYFDAIIKWHKTRNGIEGLEPKHIGYENGVLGGVVSALNVLCSKGDSVLLHSPTYIGFTKSLTNNGYHIVHSPLVKDENNVYRMDFEDMEKKIVENHIHAAIFCSPHNPTGRVWERWEIEKAMEIYKKHDVYVVSDEIWSDLLLNGHKHITTQSVSEDAKQRTVALYAPSKTFNLAGLIGSYHIIYNDWLRDRILKESSLSHYNSMNLLSMYALIGAYKPEGYEWVDELKEVLSGNVNYACDYIEKHFEGVNVSKPEGTYMLFLDCTEWCKKHGKTITELQAAGIEVGVIWQDGVAFHGPCHIRMNLALPLSRVKEAFDRLDKYVFNPQEA